MESKSPRGDQWTFGATGTPFLPTTPTIRDQRNPQAIEPNSLRRRKSPDRLETVKLLLRSRASGVDEGSGDAGSRDFGTDIRLGAEVDRPLQLIDDTGLAQVVQAHISRLTCHPGNRGGDRLHLG